MGNQFARLFLILNVFLFCMFHISYLPAASVSQFPVHTVGSNNNKVGSEAGPKTCFPFYFSCFSGDVALFFIFVVCTFPTRLLGEFSKGFHGGFH